MVSAELSTRVEQAVDAVRDRHAQRWSPTVRVRLGEPGSVTWVLVAHLASGPRAGVGLGYRRWTYAQA